MYLGNNPNSYNYDSSLPIGYIKWDFMEHEEEIEEEENIPLENHEMEDE
jgi:hypothetical protein